MANEMRHADPGTTLSEAQFIDVAEHIVNNAIAGNIIKTTATGALVHDTPSFVNLLVNGGHEIWQRGAGAFTVTSAYTSDRHQIILAGTDTISVTQEGTIKKTNSLYSAKCVFTLGSGAGASRHKQRLTISDGFYGLLGKTISVRKSIYSTAANAVRVVITTDGTGGTSTYSSYHVGNSAWADLDVPGVAVPADATYIDIGLAFAATVTAYEDNTMVVMGSVPINYVPLAPADEWNRCLRYYELAASSPNHPGVSAYCSAAGQTPNAYVLFKAKKPVSPTVTVVGTWVVINSSQPAVTRTDTNATLLYGTSVGAGWLTVIPDNVGNTLTVEANP